MKHNHWFDEPAPETTGRRCVRRSAAIIAAALINMTHMAPAAAADGDGAIGLYAGLGVADVHGSARATGSLSEKEWDNSAGLRLNLGLSARVFRALSLQAEIYDIPTHSELGLGDKATQTFGFALMPAYLVLPDTKVFVSLGLERSHTNSPVDDWRSFDTTAPVFGGGFSYSFARTLRLPVAVTARIEQANYEKISVATQTDQIKQTRYVLAAEIHF
jgi:hypothetical protein